KTRKNYEEVVELGGVWRRVGPRLYWGRNATCFRLTVYKYELSRNPTEIKDDYFRRKIVIQVLLLLCEVIDWSLAAFSPVYFHSSSLLCRILPFVVGGIFCAIIVGALIVIDATTATASCVWSPADTAVISAYDISLAFATICLIGLGVLLGRKLNSSLYKPVLFHFVCTLFLLEIPLLVVISLKYAGYGKAAVPAADATNMLVAMHSALQSAYFVYNHEDYRQGIRATFLRFRVLSAL
ncbi:hypothetical protein NECAME_16678, partial [Necator americanus]